MRVVKLLADGDRFQSIIADAPHGWEELAFDGTPRVETWVPPKVRVYKPRLKRSDFFYSMGALVISEHAREVFLEYWNMCGELLPLPCGNEMLWALNVTECIDCLDHEKSWWNGTWNLQFRIDLLSESPIFKIPETASTSVYVVDGREEDPSCEFLQQLEQSDLKGWLIREVWNDQHPEIDYS